MNYQQMTDEKLVELCQQGNSEVADYLIERYKGRAKAKARFLFLCDGDNDDLIQEGMIGIFKAIRSYDSSKGASFKTFVELCIDNQMYDAIKISNRKRNQPLNSYIPFFAYGEGQEGESELSELNRVSNEQTKSPEELIIERDNLKRIFEMLDKALSAFENEVLRLYLEGLGYREISEIMEKTPKSIDNAIQRIKQKITQIRNDIK